jgi:hypothetical protein
MATAIARSRLVESLGKSAGERLRVIRFLGKLSWQLAKLARKRSLASSFLSIFWVMVFGGTTACEKPLFQVVFVFEHFFYSSASLIL